MLLIALGAMLMVFAVAMLSLPLAIFVAGAALVGVGLLVELNERPPTTKGGTKGGTG